MQVRAVPFSFYIGFVGSESVSPASVRLKGAEHVVSGPNRVDVFLDRNDIPVLVRVELVDSVPVDRPLVAGFVRYQPGPLYIDQGEGGFLSSGAVVPKAGRYEYAVQFPDMAADVERRKCVLWLAPSW